MCSSSKCGLIFQVLTPVLRCVGNLCSGPDMLSARMCENEAVIAALGRCLHSEHRHIRKESLWAVSNMTGKDCCIFISGLQNTNKWIDPSGLLSQK